MFMKTIKDILYEMFSVDAIKAAALPEQLEDIKYCTENNMNHLKGETERKKREECRKRVEFYAHNDNERTFNRDNMRKFKAAVDTHLKQHPEATLFHGLNEIEHYAVRKLYYYNNH